MPSEEYTLDSVWARGVEQSHKHIRKLAERPTRHPRQNEER